MFVLVHSQDLEVVCVAITRQNKGHKPSHFFVLVHSQDLEVVCVVHVVILFNITVLFFNFKMYCIRYNNIYCNKYK